MFYKNIWHHQIAHLTKEVMTNAQKFDDLSTVNDTVLYTVRICIWRSTYNLENFLLTDTS